MYFDLAIYKIFPAFIADPVVDTVGTALFNLVIILLATLYVHQITAFIVVFVLLGTAFLLRWATVEQSRRNTPRCIRQAAEVHPDETLRDTESGFGGFNKNKNSYHSTWLWKRDHGYVVRGKAGWLNGIELLNRDLSIDAVTNSAMKMMPSPSPSPSQYSHLSFQSSPSPLSQLYSSPVHIKPSPRTMASAGAGTVAIDDAINDDAADQAAGRCGDEAGEGDADSSYSLDSYLAPVVQFKPTHGPPNAVSPARIGASSAPVEVNLFEAFELLAGDYESPPQSRGNDLPRAPSEDGDSASVLSKYYALDWAGDDPYDGAYETALARTVPDNLLFRAEAASVGTRDDDVKSVQSVESMFSSLASTLSYKPR